MPTPDLHPDRRFLRWAIALAALFAVCRIIFCRQISTSPLFDYPTLDSRFYFDWARSLAAGQGHPPGPFWLSPLYPLALAGLFKAVGSTLIGVAVIVQFMLSLGTLALIVIYARRLFGDAVALATAALAALYAPWLYFDGVLLTASLILFLNALLLYLIITRTDLAAETTTKNSTTIKDDVVWLGIGLLCGLSALARPSILVFGAALAVWLFMQKHPLRWRRIVFLLAAIFLPLLPVLVRNYQVSGSLLLTTSSGGVNFFIGNRAGASGLYDELNFIKSFDPEREAEGYRAEAAKRAGHEMTLNAASRYWGWQALDDIAHNPAGWARLMVKKMWLTVQREEIPTNISFRGVAGFSPIVRALPVRWGLLFPLALAGAILAWRKRRDTRLLWLYGACYLAVNLIFFSAAEYRFPLLLVLLPAAGCFIVEMWRVLKAREYARMWVGSLVYLLAMIVCNLPSKTVSEVTLPSMDYYNMATMAIDNGQIMEALPLYARSLTVDPTRRDVRIGLAQTLWRLGNFDDARQEFARAGEPAPDSISGAPLTGLLGEAETYISQNNLLAAMNLLNTSFPDSLIAPLQVVTMRASLEMRRGNFEKAAAHWQHAAQREADSPEWPYHAGRAWLMMGDTARADTALQEALHRYPAYAPARLLIGQIALAERDTFSAQAQLAELRRIRIPSDSLKIGVLHFAQKMGETYSAQP